MVPAGENSGIVGEGTGDMIDGGVFVGCCVGFAVGVLVGVGVVALCVCLKTYYL